MCIAYKCVCAVVVSLYKEFHSCCSQGSFSACYKFFQLSVNNYLIILSEWNRFKCVSRGGK